MKSDGSGLIDQTAFPPLTAVRRSVHFAPDFNDRSTRPTPPVVQFEDQPSWLDDLLDEPESPASKSLHRRASSDSGTYFGVDGRAKEDLPCRNSVPVPTLDFHKSNYYKEMLRISANGNPISPDEQQQILSKEDVASQDLRLSMAEEMQDQGDSAPQNTDAGGESCRSKAFMNSSKSDVKRAKQHNARRSRVRKLQYIAELERSLQALQTEGCLVAAELEFLDQQNLLLTMENRALKQRLESLSQVQVIKSLEQDVLEREMARLQCLYQQQNLCLQQHHSPPNLPMHRRVRSCNDYEARFANLSLRPQGAFPNSGGFPRISP